MAKDAKGGNVDFKHRQPKALSLSIKSHREMATKNMKRQSGQKCRQVQLSVIDEPLSLDLLTRERLTTTASHGYTVQPRMANNLSFLHKSRASDLMEKSVKNTVLGPLSPKDILRKVGSPVRTMPPGIAAQLDKNKNSNTVFPQKGLGRTKLDSNMSVFGDSNRPKIFI